MPINRVSKWCLNLLKWLVHHIKRQKVCLCYNCVFIYMHINRVPNFRHPVCLMVSNGIRCQGVKLTRMTCLSHKKDKKFAVATIRTYTVYPTTYTRRAMHAMHWQVQKLYHCRTTISLKVAVQLVIFKIYTLLRCVCYRQINSWELTMFLTCVSFVDRWHVLPQTRASRSVVLLDPWPKFARTNLLENCLAKTDGISLFGYSPAQQVWSE